MSAAGNTIGYATDVEGNLDFWNRYVEFSEVVHRDATGKLVLSDGCHFIYGGDTCDRGNGDLSVLRDLIYLKETYPDKVHLLMGNRDINKMRFLVATLPQVLSLQPECYFANSNANVEKIKDYKFNSTADKVKWVLLHTMGSPYAFEYRRQELQNAGLPHSDADVANSYRHIAAPAELSGSGEEGLMLRYLALAEVAVVINDVLFTHGAIQDINMGFVPFRRNSPETVKAGGRTGIPEARGYTVDDPREWCARLNAFAAAEIADYKANIGDYLQDLARDIERRQQLVHQAVGIADPSERDPGSLAHLYSHTAYPDPDSDSGEVCTGIGRQLLYDELSGYLHPQPGSGLVTLGMGDMRDGAPTRSTIYASYLRGGTPCPCSAEVARWLRSAGINRVVVGHQPHADAPFTQIVDGVQLISTDSSYSINTQWPATHFQAVHGSGRCGSGRAVQTIKEDGSDRWLSYGQYLKETGHGAASADASEAGAQGAAVIPLTAATRSPNCVAELLFTVPLADGQDEAPREPCRARVRGILSEGSSYDCELSYPLEVARSAESSGADLIGRQTRDGWFVKVTGVFPAADADAARASTPQEEGAGMNAGTHQSKGLVLLARSQGYGFFNKLVTVDEARAQLL